MPWLATVRQNCTVSHVEVAVEQAERGITRQFGGLGLGLAISKAMVEMHGGAIAVHSAGKGQEQDLQRTREVGFAAHLTKPVDLDRLASTIATVTHTGPGPPHG